MSFETRSNLSNKFETNLNQFLTSKGFKIWETGSEKTMPKDLLGILKTVHGDDTVRVVRYIPDCFAIFDNKYFFIEYKAMNSPIILDEKVESLKKMTGIDDLNKTNIGVVETEAIKNYDNLTKIKVKILVIVYCTFHPKTLLIEWEDKINQFNSDKVKLGQGNASWTPYTNIHLDKMRTIKEFFEQEFKIRLNDSEVEQLIKSIKS